jgi:hypothetical protein
MLCDGRVSYRLLKSDHLNNCFGNISFSLHLFKLPPSPTHLNNKGNRNNSQTQHNYPDLIVLQTHVVISHDSFHFVIFNTN